MSSRSPRAVVLCACLSLAAACTGKEDAALAYQVTPAELDLGESRYDGTPATGTVSFLNQDTANFYISASSVSGDGADLLVVDTEDFTEIDAGDSGDLSVAVTDDLISWKDGDQTASVTFTINADRGPTSTATDAPEDWVTETLAVAVNFSLDCDLDGDGEDAEACDGADCDDTDVAVNPAATEMCDGIDNNCDGEVDEATAADATTWYADADGDTYGDPATSEIACDAPHSYVANAADCDDTDNHISPDEAEVCDGVDNDCDGETDEGDATDALVWYEDVDGDAYGNPDATVTACTQPDGAVPNNQDCNDDDATQSPDATEICDGIDNNCDGEVDEGC